MIEKLLSFLTKQKIGQHLLFWLFSFVFLSFMEYSTTHGPIASIVLKQFINVAFYATMVYGNIYYLIPNYFQDKRYPAYFLVLILFVIIVTPIYSFLLYIIAFNDPFEKAELLKLKNYYYFFNFFIVGASTVFVIIKDWIFQKREKRELENRNMQSELNFLKSQINPHFLFNTLNSLYALTLKKSDKAPDVVIKLSEMMRYMLYECNEKFVPLENELIYLQNYIELEKLRQPDSIHIDFRIEGNTDSLMIAPLIIISFLENAFKHGISTSIDFGFVNIHFRISGQILEFKIENSKTEFQQKQNNKIGGIGLINAQKRLDMIYPDQHTLEIIDTQELYTVLLNINLNNEI
ncbi:MAG: sensor histidine kinase [Saprospiraceae bacterium]|jgi:two-component system LytT family sensor kinase|nr:sensor histidine kinase [Saprospiraceae bacterium]